MTNVDERAWVLPDTNVFLKSPDELNGYNIVVLGCVLRELEKHKSSPRRDLAYEARIATRYIKDRISTDSESIRFVGEDYDSEAILGSEFHNTYFDNQIVAACQKLNVALISYDILLQLKAKSFKIDVIGLDEEVTDDVTKYTGIRELFLSNKNEDDSEFIAQVYENPSMNNLGLVQNEYLLMWDKDKPTYDDEGNKVGYELIDVLRFDGRELVKLKYKPTEDIFMGKTKPVNVKQRIAFDIMQNKEIGVVLVTGGAGSGKDKVMAAHMMQALHREEIDKIVFVRNIVALKDAGQTGYLPGDLREKMKNWAAPFIDKIGGEDAFDMLYDKGKIEIQHFEAIRGRSFDNTGIYVTELQSMTSEHAEMLLERVGENSFIYLNGDTNQIDAEVFRRNSAINTLKKLKGHRLFGTVTLDKNERSEIASLGAILRK